jgi:hypothetical protein
MDLRLKILYQAVAGQEKSFGQSRKNVFFHMRITRRYDVVIL